MPTSTPNDIDRICIEVGKLRTEVNEIKSNHLVHLKQAVNWCNTKVNFILVGAGLTLAMTALILALVAVHMTGD